MIICNGCQSELFGCNWCGSTLQIGHHIACSSEGQHFCDGSCLRSFHTPDFTVEIVTTEGDEWLSAGVKSAMNIIQ